MSEPRWLLSRTARIAEHRQTLTVFGRNEQRRFDGASAVLARAVLELLRSPQSRDALLTALELQFEGVRDRSELLDELLNHLRASGSIAEHVTRHEPPSRPLAASRVALAATGAVATSFTPLLVSLLQNAGAEVRVALTRSARRFVTVRALEALTHHPIGTSLWNGTAAEPAPHLALAEWADLVLIAPASATTLSRLVQGDCSELVAAVAIATRGPVILAPSMNPAMLAAPSVRRNLDQLRDDGFHVVWPSSGFEVAARPGARTLLTGPMLPPEELVAIVRALMPTRAETPRPDAAFWDGVYAHPPSQLPWHSPTVDPDLAAVLKQGRGRLLDLGCGLGTVAIAAARLGYQVTASDVSPVALDAARAAAGELAIDFVADDFLRSTLDGPFDVIVDRAVLHTLPTAAHDRYLRQLARLLSPGARLLLKVHSDPDQTRTLGTTCFDLPRLTALLAPELQIESCLESSLPGALDPAPRALCVVARRA